MLLLSSVKCGDGVGRPLRTAAAAAAEGRDVDEADFVISAKTKHQAMQITLPYSYSELRSSIMDGGAFWRGTFDETR